MRRAGRRYLRGPAAALVGGNSAAYAGLTPTLYAAPTSQGTGSGNSEANAMSLSSALAAVTAGAILGVLPGTYTGTNTSDRFQPAWKTTNSGTSGNPIRIVAKNVAAIHASNLSELRSGTTTDGAGCPAFGAYGNPSANDYVEWIGFYVDEANSATRADTGPAVLVATTGSAIRLCHLAAKTAYLPGDNHCGVRVEGSYNVTVADTKIHGFRNSAVNVANGCGIETYTSGNVLVENNEIYDCFAGIHHKANGDDAGAGPSGDTADGVKGWFITRRNRVYSCYHYGIINGRSYSGFDRDLYLNTVQVDAIGGGGGGFGLTYWNYSPDDPTRIRVQNNTVVVSTSNGSLCIGVYHKGPLGASNTFNGNLVVAGDRAIYQESVSTFTTTQWAADRNLYYGYASFADITNGSGNPLSTFASTYGIDGNSVNADPLFVNQAGLDLRLQAGSPALGLARDVLNVTGLGVNAVIAAGAYAVGTETIGIRS